MKVALKAGLKGFALMAALAVAVPAYAIMPAPQPIPLRVAHADVIVSGKVTKIEDKTISTTSYPGVKDKFDYQIAVVKVSDAILNAKGMKEIRVGFIPPPPPANPGGGRPIVIGPRFRGVTFTEDEEGCLMLTKHHECDFYILADHYYGAIKKANNTNYEKEVEETKKAAKLLADPMASLKSKDADERFQTAAMLIECYRTPKPSATPPNQEPIDAAESKLILEALRDADWTQPKPMPGRFMIMTPINSFSRLQLTKEDKWVQPLNENKIQEAVQAWLKDNAGTYRIKKFVAVSKEDKKDKEPEKNDK
jgi:hypothetical protein